MPAIARARARVPELRGEILGDGPARPEVLRLIAEHALERRGGGTGFVDEDRLRSTLRRALCLALPSRREGYGLVVVEAAALGVPSVVVRGPDNAATELVEEGENGAVADSVEASDLADAILRVHAAGPTLRESTAAWYSRNATGSRSIGRSNKCSPLTRKNRRDPRRRAERAAPLPGETGGSELYARRLVGALAAADDAPRLVVFAPHEAAASLAAEPWRSASRSFVSRFTPATGADASSPSRRLYAEPWHARACVCCTTSSPQRRFSQACRR